MLRLIILYIKKNDSRFALAARPKANYAFKIHKTGQSLPSLSVKKFLSSLFSNGVLFYKSLVIIQFCQQIIKIIYQMTVTINYQLPVQAPALPKQEIH